MPLYASHACRQRAYAARLERRDLVPIDDAAVLEVVAVAAAPSPGQIQQAIVEARAAAFALKRLGRTAPPAVSWRCQRAGAGIMAALVESFGDGVG